MFEVLDRGDLEGAYMVRGTESFAGQIAIFFGPEARERAEAYAQWLNAGAAHQRRRTDPGFKDRTGDGSKGRTNPER
jgi:hypothetical protein